MTKIAQAVQEYKAADYPGLSEINGFSSQLMSNHVKLYQGYVANTNILSEKLTDLLDQGAEKSQEYSEMKRRFGWEFNGMRLHELYFDNMRGDGILRPKSPLYTKLEDAFGSVEAWRREFTGIGAMRGVGWVALCRDLKTDRLFNIWINEHDGGHLSGCTPLLVMDMFEHAYLLDYQLDKASYMFAFFNTLNWREVSNRYTRQ